MGSSWEAKGTELLSVALESVSNEINRLESNLRDKERELGVAYSEIKALKAAKLLKDKAFEDQMNETTKLQDKLRFTEKQFEDKIASLLNDKKALERQVKSKETALIAAEKIIQHDSEGGSSIEALQNQNFELKKQIEILTAENKLFEKTNRQKVADIQMLTRNIRELEESILASGSTSNSVRYLQRQITELNAEKRNLDRELARVKASMDRTAMFTTNQWKEDNEEVNPPKQWLEKRRVMQAEVQRLQNKLAVLERIAKDK